MLPAISRAFGVVTLLLLAVASGAVPATTSDLFPRPAGLERDIAFWTSIYTEVASDSGVLHDSRNLSIRYETMAFPADITRRTRSKKIEKRKKHYRAILDKLARGKHDGLNAEEQRVLSLWPAETERKTFSKAAKAIRFQLGQADRFRAGLVRSGRYRSFIESVLAERGLPLELAALPHVESSFNPSAYSKVGAAGMWQFTRSTGRRYMRVDHVVDERRDPYLSTVAAAKLLENNHSVTGSWPLALTGYNHGVSGMRRAARRHKTDDIETIARNYKSRTFGFASRNFYVAFLAALQIDQDPEKYFGTVTQQQPIQNSLLTVDGYIRADGLAEALGIRNRLLEEMNPALLASVWTGAKHIPKGFTLRLPTSQLETDPEAVLAGLDASNRYTRQLPDVTHKVGRGDTLSGIADRYGVRMAHLVELNGLRSRHRIRAGQVLRLPTKGQVAAPSVVVAAAQPSKPAPKPALAPEPTVAQAEPVATVAVVPIETSIAEAPDVADDSDPAQSAFAPADVGLAADPSDYSVASNGSIEVQALETLGHYGDWLELKTQRLRNLNGYEFRRPVVVGHRLKLDFARVDREAFEARRIAYHRNLQEAFFLKYRIRDAVQHTIRRGESLWVLAQRNYDVPVWLLRQYNPDLNLDRIRPGMRIQFPVLERIDEPAEQLRATAKAVRSPDSVNAAPLAN